MGCFSCGTCISISFNQIFNSLRSDFNRILIFWISNFSVWYYFDDISFTLWTFFFLHRNNEGVKVKQMSVFTNENPSAKLTGLQPYTAYQITVSAENTIGTSLDSQPSDIFYTDSEGTDIMMFVVYLPLSLYYLPFVWICLQWFIYHL